MNRIQSVEVVRVVSIVAVVVIHVTPIPPLGSELLGHDIWFWVVLNQLCRFAVPFFFVVSGYFWGMKIRTGSNVMSISWAAVKRVVWLWVAWCVIYLMPYNISALFEFGPLGPAKVAYWRLLSLIGDPMRGLLVGTRAHLWFLLGLGIATYATALLLRYAGPVVLGATCVGLYLAGVLCGSYSATLNLEWVLNTRNGLCFGTPLFATGYYLSGRIPRERWFRVGGALFLSGSCLHLLEMFCLWKWFSVWPIHDYVFGTYLAGVGVALMGLSDHEALRAPKLARFGPLVLGIYASHIIFVDLLEPIAGHVRHPLWTVTYIALVLTLSGSAAFWLKRQRWGRKLVT